MAEPFLARDLRVTPIDIYIDPPVPRARAIVTHGHADHARAGHGAVLATPDTIAIMQTRYGADCAGRFESLAYGEVRDIDGVKVSLHPAGHILGSAQVLLEFGGKRIVVTGDYKRLPDRTAQRFELVTCDLLVTEATFGLPVFQHPDPLVEIGRLLHSLTIFADRAHVVGCYALGKAQRVIALLRQAGYDAPIYLHGAMSRLCALYEERGIALGDLRPVMEASKAELMGPLVTAPPGAGARSGIGVDECQAAGAAGGRRVAAGDLRPCRLERASPDDHGDRRRDGVGDAWARGCAGVLEPAAGAEGGAAQHRRL